MCHGLNFIGLDLAPFGLGMFSRDLDQLCEDLQVSSAIMGHYILWTPRNTSQNWDCPATLPKFTVRQGIQLSFGFLCLTPLLLHTL